MNAADVIADARAALDEAERCYLVERGYMDEAVPAALLNLIKVAEEQATTIAATPAGQCTCLFTDPATWTKYYGAVEPGSTQEYDPTCPTHGKLRERAERAEATIARVRALVTGGEQREATSLTRMFNGDPFPALFTTADIRAALDGEGHQ